MRHGYKTKEAIMKKFCYIMKKFTEITTGELISVTVFTNIIYKVDVIESDMLWQILVTSLLCALSIVIYPDVAVSRRKAITLSIVHYLIIVLIVMLSGYEYNWYAINSARSITYILTTITIVFVIISAISWKKSAIEADKMNKKLEEYHNDNFNAE